MHRGPGVPVGLPAAPVPDLVVVQRPEPLVVVLVAPDSQIDVVLQHQRLKAEADLGDPDPDLSCCFKIEGSNLDG